MKGPGRPAPSVPKLGVNRYSPVTNWNDDPFGADVFEPTPDTMHKKKPPPRPPPPKLKQPDVPAKPSHFIRRPTVLSSLLSRNKNNKNTNQNINGITIQNKIMEINLEDTQKMFPKCEVKPVQMGALIDLSSPPSSPTFTTRSSSDGLSVDSFGSDATNSTNHHHLPGGGSVSQPESGFEDDFDLFLTSRKMAKDNTLDDFASLDPFSPPPVVKPPVVKKPPLSRDLYDLSTVTSNMPSAPTPILKGPTIIRAKPARPKPPDNTALLKTTFGGNFPVTSMNVNTSTTPIQKVYNGFPPPESFESRSAAWKESSPPCVNWDREESATSSSRESSPPMPTVPPPPPPADAVDWPVDAAVDATVLADNLTALQDELPHAVALFNYNTGHPDDLRFSVNDRIELERRVDDEWLFGRLRSGAEGLFPANYVEIKVPLPGESAEPSLGTATALFDLTPVEPSDLGFQAGDTITVLQRLSDEWYFGQCNGRKGQFPANYVQMH